MEIIITLIIGLIMGFAFVGLGIWGVLVGKTLGAVSKLKGDVDGERAKVYGLIWLLTGFLVLITVVFKAQHALNDLRMETINF